MNNDCEWMAITSDGWTTAMKKGEYFNTITGHYISLLWELRMHVLDCSTLDSIRHTNVDVYDHWKKRLEKYPQKRIVACTVDGAGEYRIAAEKLVNQHSGIRIWCMCHRLHLVAKEITSLPTIKSFVSYQLLFNSFIFS
jgi:hypothetical protein